MEPILERCGQRQGSGTSMTRGSGDRGTKPRSSRFSWNITKGYSLFPPVGFSGGETNFQKWLITVRGYPWFSTDWVGCHAPTPKRKSLRSVSQSVSQGFLLRPDRNGPTLKHPSQGDPRLWQHAGAAAGFVQHVCSPHLASSDPKNPTLKQSPLPPRSFP